MSDTVTDVMNKLLEISRGVTYTRFDSLKPGALFRFAYGWPPRANEMSAGQRFQKGKGRGWYRDLNTGRSYQTGAGSAVLELAE